MKTFVAKVLPLLGLAAAMPLAHAQDKVVRVIPDTHEATPKTERRVIIKHGPGDPAAMEKAAFLGVETAPVSVTLTVQLNLPKGAGLVVQAVVPDSPAATTLKPHDILLKLDDQLLIEPRQFSVLMRSHKEGDEVTLTYVRAGKEATAKVKLALHDVPKLALTSGYRFETGPDGATGMGREAVDHLLSLTRGSAGATVQSWHVGRAGESGSHLTKVGAGDSKMLYTDDAGALELTISEGKQSLVAKNAKGEPLFSGPVTTPEERKAMPPEVRERLEKLEGMQEFSFKTGDDFQPSEMKVLQAPARRIAAPLPPQPTGRAPMFF